jgi:hypothetical protein
MPVVAVLFQKPQKSNFTYKKAWFFSVHLLVLFQKHLFRSTFFSAPFQKHSSSQHFSTTVIESKSACHKTPQKNQLLHIKRPSFFGSCAVSFSEAAFLSTFSEAACQKHSSSQHFSTAVIESKSASHKTPQKNQVLHIYIQKGFFGSFAGSFSEFETLHLFSTF